MMNKTVKRVLERAAKTAVQSTLALVTVNGVFNIDGLDLKKGAIVVAGATLVSVLTSLASLLKGDSTDPSLVD